MWHTKLKVLASFGFQIFYMTRCSTVISKVKLYSPRHPVRLYFVLFVIKNLKIVSQIKEILIQNVVNMHFIIWKLVLLHEYLILKLTSTMYCLSVLVVQAVQLVGSGSGLIQSWLEAAYCHTPESSPSGHNTEHQRRPGV